MQLLEQLPWLFLNAYKNPVWILGFVSKLPAVLLRCHSLRTQLCLQFCRLLQKTKTCCKSKLLCKAAAVSHLMHSSSISQQTQQLSEENAEGKNRKKLLNCQQMTDTLSTFVLAASLNPIIGFGGILTPTANKIKETR